MNAFTRRVLLVLFLLSGFASLVYQVVWTRLAFASFGIITPVLSVVLSVFMLGLALGSWAGGRWIGSLTAKTGWSAAFFYAAAEGVIGLGAFVVPKLFTVGENILLASGQTNSFTYLSLSALVLAVAILPWCVCMGTTYPLMMAYIREREGDHSKSFSFLYLANVLGAMSGTFLSAVVYIELLGFHRTLWLAAGANFIIVIISISLGLASKPKVSTLEIPVEPSPDVPGASPDALVKWILFSTGFIAMAMEVVWTRAFTPVLKTQVYSFALIVFVYLGATFLGSWLYRRDLSIGKPKSKALLLAGLAVAAFLPVIINDPKFLIAIHNAPVMNVRSALVLLASIVPFCGLLGYLTPGLIDDYAGGYPNRAGRAYAINVLGCILGPLAACYLLLPNLSEKCSLIVLTLPFLVFCLKCQREYSRRLAWALPLMVVLALGWSVFGTGDFVEVWQRESGTKAVVRRDYAATVIAVGKGWGRDLIVNGVGMTRLVPLTKYMVHLPLVYHQTPPKSALVICFGMGTTFRAAMSWNIDTTVVELIPSVAKMFDYYHDNAAQVASAPNGHIITDDGRRFLKRTRQKFDVIVVDPPPPVQAAGSSLLFSTEFYDLAKEHLNPGGIVQMWFPGDRSADMGQAVLRSICERFPYVRVFRSAEGWHLLGSMEPIAELSAQQLADRMPESARKDLVEWFDTTNVTQVFQIVQNRELSVPALLNPNPAVVVTDDKPYNEYFLLRSLRNPSTAR